MSTISKNVYAVGKEIEGEWFNGGATSKFFTKYEEYDKFRKYARGEHEVEHSKSIITNGAESSHTNYDFSPVQILPKFKDKLRNDMFPQLYNIEANALDKYSTDLKNKERERLMDRFLSKDLDQDMMEFFGIDMEAGYEGDRPNSEEEVDMRMNMEWKPNVEIAGEEAIKYTFDLNSYEEILIDLLDNAIDLGRCGVWISMNPAKGIEVESFDPAEAIWSYPKKRDHSDVWYFGRRKRMTFASLLEMTDKVYDINKKESILLTEDFIKRTLRGSIQELYRSGSQPTRNDTSELDLNEKVDVLYFTYETVEIKHLKVKEYKSGIKKITEYKGEYDGKPKKGFEVITERKKVWKEGYLILGSNYGWGAKTVNNLAIKNKDGIKKVFPPAIMYANSLYKGKAKGMIERATTIIDKIQTTEVKIQQLVASAKPSGIRIDVTKINQIQNKDGSFLDYQTVLKIYNETGIELYSSGNGDHGEFSQGNIHELRNGVVDGLLDLVTIQNNYLNQLRDALGMPQGVDASSPHPDTAVKVYEQVTRNSNISVRHVLDSVLKVTASASENIFERVKDVFQYYPEIKESYVKAIGKINVGIIDELEQVHLADLGIKVTLKPDARSQALLEENIQKSLSANLITLDDAEEVREVGERSMKLARHLLKAKRLKKEREDEEREQRRIELNGDQEVKRIEAETARDAAKFEGQASIEDVKAQSKAEAEIAVLQEKHRIFKEEQSILHRNAKELAVINNGTVNAKTMYQEEQKNKRQDKNNTDTSKITEQRLNNSPAQDFTSS